MDVFKDLGRTEEAALRAVIDYVDQHEGGKQKDVVTIKWIQWYIESRMPWDKEFPGTTLRRSLDTLHRKHLVTQSLRLNETRRYELQFGVTQRGRNVIAKVNNLNEAFKYER